MRYHGTSGLKQASGLTTVIPTSLLSNKEQLRTCTSQDILLSSSDTPIANRWFLTQYRVGIRTRLVNMAPRCLNTSHELDPKRLWKQASWCNTLRYFPTKLLSMILFQFFRNNVRRLSGSVRDQTGWTLALASASGRRQLRTWRSKLRRCWCTCS